MGFGTNNGQAFDDLFRYDPTSDSWNQVASLGIGMQDPCYFVVGNIAYVGLGNTRISNSLVRHFYGYNPQTNSWSQISDNNNFDYYSLGTGFSYGNKGSVAIISTDSSARNTICQYNPSNDSWSEM